MRSLLFDLCSVESMLEGNHKDLIGSHKYTGSAPCFVAPVKNLVTFVVGLDQQRTGMQKAHENECCFATWVNHF